MTPSDLERTRDHARRMAELTKPPDCDLWRQIADEIDAYLGGPDEDEPLFGG